MQATTARTIGGLFNDKARGEATLEQLKAAGFKSAQISEVHDDENESAPKKLANPATDFFSDHTASGSEFQENLVSLGMSDADARHFEDGVARGGSLVTVKADDRAAEAISILERNHADLGSLVTRSAATPRPDTANDRDAEKMLQLRAERLSVDKVRVASGEARIRKAIVIEQQTIQVPVMHEELVIERHAVTNGTVGGAVGDEESIVVPLAHEEVNVSKSAYVTEEVGIGKRMVSENERVSDDVRHEELVVDDGRSTAERSAGI